MTGSPAGSDRVTVKVSVVESESPSAALASPTETVGLETGGAAWEISVCHLARAVSSRATMLLISSSPRPTPVNVYDWLLLTMAMRVEPLTSSTVNSWALNQPKSSVSAAGSNSSVVWVPYCHAIVVVVPVCPLGGAPFPAAVGQSSVPAIGTPWGRTWELGTVPIPSCRCNRSSRTWALWKMKFVAVSWAVVTPCRIRA